MGIPGLWAEVEDSAEVHSLTALAVHKLLSNDNGHRGYRIGIDASIWFFHADYGREGENPELRTLFFRCATLLHAPFLPLFIFDGPQRPAWKRGKKITKTKHSLTSGMMAIIEAFGFEHRTAPGEAEAELAYLNNIGLIDGILTDDVDTFVFGGKTVLRNVSNNLSGNRSKPTLNSDNRDDKNHVRIFNIDKMPLTMEHMILCALLSGGDYDQGGIVGCGLKTAIGLCKSGFANSLYKAATTLNGAALNNFLEQWRDDLRREIKTNSMGYMGRKAPSLAAKIHDNFPNLEVLDSYIRPVTSYSKNKQRYTELNWSKDPSLPALARLCEQFFEWGIEATIVKRFRTLMWSGLIMRVLRRNIIERDKGKCFPARFPVTGSFDEDDDVLPSTPHKKYKKADDVTIPAGSTPSKLVSQHFTGSTVNPVQNMRAEELLSRSPRVQPSLQDDDMDGEDLPLIESLVGFRRHASTDELEELRLVINPGILVRLTKQGVTGMRENMPGYKPDNEEWSDEAADDNAYDGKGTKNDKKVVSPPPTDALRVWVPVGMLKIAEPEMVKAWDEKQQKKLDAKKKKGTGSRAKTTPSNASKEQRKAKSITAKGKGKKKAPIQEEEEEGRIPHIYLSSDDEDDELPQTTSHRPGTHTQKSASQQYPWVDDDDDLFQGPSMSVNELPPIPKDETTDELIHGTTLSGTPKKVKVKDLTLKPKHSTMPITSLHQFYSSMKPTALAKPKPTKSPAPSSPSSFQATDSVDKSLRKSKKYIPPKHSKRERSHSILSGDNDSDIEIISYIPLVPKNGSAPSRGRPPAGKSSSTSVTTTKKYEIIEISSGEEDAPVPTKNMVPLLAMQERLARLEQG